MSKSQSSLRSVGILTICSFVQLCIQVGITLVLARQFGATNTMDAYNAALSLPMVISAFLVGSLSAVFVPVYTDYRLNDSKASGHRFSSQLGLLLFAVCFLISVCCYLYAEPIIANLHKGFGVEQVKQAAKVFRILTWLTITNGLTSFLNSLHHGEKRFRTSAFAGLIGVSMTFCLLLFEPVRSSITSVAWALLAGSVVCVLLQSKLFIINFSWRLKRPHPAMRKLFALMIPIIIAGLFLHVGQLVDRYLASEEVGSISQLGYAWRIISAMMALTSSFAVVVFPTLSVQKAANQMNLFISEVAHGFRFLAVLLIPITVGLGFFSEPIIRDLFQRGLFTAKNTQEVAFLVLLYLAVIACSALSTVAGRIYYALNDTLTPMLLALFITPISILLKFYLGNVNSYGAQGIAAATSVTYILAAIGMITFIHIRLGRKMYDGLLETLLAVLPSTAVAIGLAAFFVQLPMRFSALIAAPVGAVSYLLLMRLFRNEFAIRMLSYLTNDPNR